MSDVMTRYKTVADGFTERLRGVRPDQLSTSTPCEEWTARELIGHVIATHGRVLATLDDGHVTELEERRDLTEQWLERSDAVQEALADPSRATRIIGGPFGDQPFESLVGRLLCADTLLHTWDLARATGQDEHLDPEAVASAKVFLEPIDDAIRRPGGFGPKREAPPGADEQTELLSFAGRPV